MRSLIRKRVASSQLSVSCYLIAGACLGISFNAEDAVLSVAVDEEKDSVAIFNQSELLTVLPSSGLGLGPLRSSKYLAEQNNLCLCFGNGDILLVDIEEPYSATIAGSIEGGIQAAEWSPDEELLVLVTTDNQLLLLTKDFDVLAEQLLKTDDFGEDKLVNLGWGNIDTQFKGSIGKNAGRTTNAAQETDALLAGKDDDFLARVSWRGDGAHFAVSSVESLDQSTSKATFRRSIRFYSRLAVHQSTAEVSPGLEHNLSWQPSGAIIAATMKTSNGDGLCTKRDVIFYERNGLRRYDFPLRFPDHSQIIVDSLNWNSDSSILAICAKNTTTRTGVIQLWTRNNYHWYLKQELEVALDYKMFWHPERPLDLYVSANDTISNYTFSWDVFRSNASPPSDSGLVAVVDGANLLVTPFRYQNVPPPMSTYTLNGKTDSTPVHACFAPEFDIMAAIYSDFTVDVCFLAASKPNEGAKWEAATCRLPNCEELLALQIAISWDDESKTLAMFVLCSKFDSGVVLSATWDLKGPPIHHGMISLDSQPAYITTFNGRAFFVEASGSSLQAVDCKGQHQKHQPTAAENCEKLAVYEAQDGMHAVTLSHSGRLSIDTNTIATDCTSFSICGSYLVFTTSSHTARFLSLERPEEPSENMELTKSEARRVERGSKIVTAVASSMSLILQMPRGNLETICPRPLVLQVVYQQIDNLEYDKAFMNCRKHRVDLNILHDYDSEAFMENLSLFVQQVGDPDHINLFLTSIRTFETESSDSTAEARKTLQARQNTSNQICAAMRNVLQESDKDRYTNSIITSYACQSPPDLESALELVSRIRATNKEAAEDAVKYVIFLSDADKLFDIALGIYDFSLVMLIAQHSNKDPKEYLPFLRELRQLPPHLQRHKINNHLRKYPKALQDLVNAGPEHFNELLAYLKLHSLYQDAIAAFAADLPSFQKVHLLYGRYLFEQSYELAGATEQAIEAYSFALDWRQALNLAINDGETKSESVQDLAHDLAKRLALANRFSEAAQIHTDYTRDVSMAIAVCCEGSHFEEALRLVALHNKSELVGDIIAPAVLDTADVLEETLVEVCEQIQKQVKRIGELDGIRQQDPDAFFGDPDFSGLDGVDVDDSASTVAGTAFTRYTARGPPTQAASRFTSATGRTSKSRRKDTKKKMTGEKKGTIWEEDYLLGSLSRMALTRLPQLQSEAEALLPLIVRLAKTHKDGLNRSIQLQKTLSETEDNLRAAVKVIWSADSPRSVEEQAKRDTTGLVKIPILGKSSWKLAMLAV